MSPSTMRASLRILCAFARTAAQTRKLVSRKDAKDAKGGAISKSARKVNEPLKEFMTIGKHVSSGSRRSFLKRASWGLTGSLIASGGLSGFSWAQESETSLKITKVEPHLLTGVRGYGPWLLERGERACGSAGRGGGRSLTGGQRMA